MKCKHEMTYQLKLYQYVSPTNGNLAGNVSNLAAEVVYVMISVLNCGFGLE